VKILLLIIFLSYFGLSHEGKHKHFHYNFRDTGLRLDSLENAAQMDSVKYAAIRDSSIKFLDVHDLTCFFHWSESRYRILPNNILYKDNKGLQAWFKIHPECLEKIKEND